MTSNKGNQSVATMARGLLLDVGMPTAAYFLAELAGASTYMSLLVGTVAAGARLAWVGIRQRRIDPFVGFLFALFAIGLVLTFVTGDARFLLVKDSAQSFIAGLAFTISCVINRPLALYAAQRFARNGSDDDVHKFATDNLTPDIRRRFFIISLVWGIGLLLESAIRVAVVYTAPLNVAANASQILSLAAFGTLIAWTIQNVHRAKARAAAGAA